MRHRRRAFLVAALLLTAYAALDFVYRSPAAVVGRIVWVAALIGAAVVQRDGSRRLADVAARLIGLVSGAGAVAIVHGFGGPRGVYFGFLYGLPVVVLVLVPDLPSSAALAGLSTTVGGVLLLARDHQPLGVLVQFGLLSATLSALGAWGTVLYGRLFRDEVTSHRLRAEALQQLTETEERFHAAFSATTLGACIASMDGDILTANPALHDMLGQTRLEGKSYFDLLAPEDVASAKSIRDVLVQGATAPRVRRRFVRADGQQVIASVHASALSRSGQPDAAIIMLEDVTERLRLRENLAASEALFRDLAERAMVGVYVVQDGLFQYANPRLAEIFGYEREELIGKVENLALAHPDDRALVAENVRSRLASESAGLQFGFRGVKKSGEIVAVEVFGTRTMYRSRPAIIGTLLDVTAQRKAEEDRIRYQKLESVGLLAGGIAHDFNNLLAAIMADISVAKDRAGSDALLTEVLEEAESATVRARDLTKQLLTFSRGGEPVRKAVALPELVVASASFAVRGSRARCEYGLPADLWPVDADEGQIGQVVQNLALNAVQAMVEGGVVRISASNVPADAAAARGLAAARHVQVTVSDTGPGVPPELAARVFDPYFTTKSTGSGLGLAAAHSIITRHGGRMGVEPSRPGSGATFYFLIPAADRDAGRSPCSRAPAATRRRRIVVMDDDELVRKAAARILGRLGHDVLLARDGGELLALCGAASSGRDPIDVAIMDLTVPGGMGGAEAVRLLRQKHPGIKAIVSSGYSSDAVVADHRRHGFDGVVAKPYRLEDMAEALEDALAPAPRAQGRPPRVPVVITR